MEREDFSLQGAWAQVGDLYAWIVSLFGAPAGIAARLLLRREDRRQLLSWLGPVEALARRLLLLKALTMAPPNLPPPPAAIGRLHSAFTDRPHRALPPEAENWRVRFCVLPYGAMRRAQLPACETRAGGAACGGGVNLNAAPLARRLEALRRVLENPAPALARLARLLNARREIVAAAFGPYRPPATPVRSLLPLVQSEIERALNTS